MKKYAKVINEETKACEVGLGTNNNFYASIGMEEMEVEQAYNGEWYVAGYAPSEPEKTYAEKRLAEYPSIQEQLDMQYWDMVNGTTIWKDTIDGIKAKYPKPITDEVVAEIKEENPYPVE